MNQCPKCNSCRISGPHYFKDSYGSERLDYRCNNCGYVSSIPTADADAQSGWRFPFDKSVRP